METVLFFGLLIFGIVFSYLADPIDFLLMLSIVIGTAVSVAVVYFVWGF
ncbi:MAG: hypothetical protein M0Z65_10865 [Firmicutes bacterium]|nr:hypothetical protein [Bacillota bacterium]